jgi:LacI family transcriptional regulator
MVRHLVDCGYRRIAFIAGPEDNFEAHERQRGYLDALKEAGLESEAWMIPGDFGEASGHRAGQLLVESSHRPDAVFAANDMMALGCLFALNQSGVRVPDEIALAGFDDIPLARYVHPALTTMRVDIPELGARAMRMLLDDVAAPLTTPLPLPTELIVRASTGARGDSS